MVERGCEEFAGVREGEVIGDTDGKETSADAGRGRAESDAVEGSVSVDQNEGKVGHQAELRAIPP